MNIKIPLILSLVLLFSCGENLEPVEEATVEEEPSIKEITYNNLQGIWELQSVSWYEMPEPITINKKQVFFIFTDHEITVESDHEFIGSMRDVYTLFDLDDMRALDCPNSAFHFGEAKSDAYIRVMMNLKTTVDPSNTLRGIRFLNNNTKLILEFSSFSFHLANDECYTSTYHGPKYILTKKDTNTSNST